MGPTCAKKSGHLDQEPELQIEAALWMDDGSQLSPRLQALKESHQQLRRPKPSSLPKLSQRGAPKPLYEKFIEAKTAFDELFREFCSERTILYGEQAFEAYSGLKSAGAVEHSFDDPVLKWLEPEHELYLVVDHASNAIYYWRVLNGTYTLLKLDPKQSAEAMKNVAIILGFSAAVKAYRTNESVHQLSLSGIG
jgi:hypothetical protein